MLSLRSFTMISSLIHLPGVSSLVNEQMIVTKDKLMKISLGYRLICNKNLCNHDYIPVNGIALLNYNDNQLDSLSRRIFNN